MRANRDFRRLPFDPSKMSKSFDQEIDEALEEQRDQNENGEVAQQKSTFFLKGQEEEFERAVEEAVGGRKGESFLEYFTNLWFPNRSHARLLSRSLPRRTLFSSSLWTFSRCPIFNPIFSRCSISVSVHVLRSL